MHVIIWLTIHTDRQTSTCGCGFDAVKTKVSALSVDWHHRTQRGTQREATMSEDCLITLRARTLTCRELTVGTDPPSRHGHFPGFLVDWCRVCLCKQLLSSVQWPVKTLIMWFLICFSNNISKIIHLVLMWWGRGSVFKCTCLWLTGLPLNRLTNSVVDSGFYLFIYPRGFFYIIERHFREMKTDPESVCFDVADEVRR